MFRTTGNARRKSRGGLGSALALALSLAGGAVVGTAVTVTPALAQNSKGFVAAYKPVNDIANTEGGDFAAAKAQFPRVVAAIETDDDKNLAGNLGVILGSKLNDPALQRQGLELMLQSGKVAPANLGEVQFLIGRLAFDAKDFAAARTALQAGIAAGRTADNPELIIAESYFQEGQIPQGLQYLHGVIDQHVAAGQPVPEPWLLRGIQAAYKANLPAETLEWSVLLAKHSPSDQRWLQSLQVVNSLSGGDKQVQLDVLRLMLLTNTLTARGEFESYIQAADPRIMSNEVARVLDAASKAGVLSAGDQFYDETRRTADARATADRKEAPQMAADARKAANGRDAKIAGDVFLSLGSYAEAEEMFKLALDKGGVDRDEALTRIGIAQVNQGKYADAQQTLAQVSGNRQTVASLWAAYAASRA